MPAVVLQLFGVPTVLFEGRRIELPRSAPAALLVYLAVAGDWVAREELAYLFRPDDPETEALTYLRLQLHRAQRLAWAQGLEAAPQRVRWLVETDLAAFRAARERRDWTAAIAAYAGPLGTSLDRGQRPTFESWLEIERGDAERAFAVALEARAGELERDGVVDEAAVLLRRRAALDPFDEPSAAAHVALLVRAGRAGDAQRAYDDFAVLLARELDAEPAPETRALLDEARDRPALGATVSPAETSLALPAAATRFIGRRRELAQLRGLLDRDGCRWVTIVGLGGSGKTRLAIELAHARRLAHPDGVAYVAAEPIGDADALLDAIGRAFGLGSDPGERTEARLIAQLAGRRALLLLDNLEHLADAAPVLSRLLAGTSALTVVATSRAAVRIAGEWLYDLAGLAYPSDDGPSSDLVGVEAVELFVAAVLRVSPQATFDAASLRQVARICRALQGLPLGLELAAAWTRVMPLERIADEVEAGFELLTSDLADMPERHRSLRGVLDRTWAGLSPAKRATLARLSVFAGGCTLEAAERVTGARLPLLLSLVNQSLLQRGPGERFASHPLVAQYAAGVLAQDGAEHAAAHAAHAAHFAARLEAAGRAPGRAGAELIKAFEPELTNLERAWTFLLDAGDHATALGMAKALFDTYDLLGHDRRGLALCASTVARLEGRAGEGDAGGEPVNGTDRVGPADPVAAELAATVRLAGAGMAREAGDLRTARRHAASAAQAAEQHGWPTLGARALQQLGDADQIGGSFDAAERAYLRAIDLFEAQGATLDLANTLNSLASLEATQERYAEATGRFLRCVELFEQLGDHLSKAIALTNLGYLAEAQGGFDLAARRYEAGLEVFERVGYTRGVAAVKNNLVVLYGTLGRLDEAEAVGRESLALKEASHDELGMIITLKNLGDLQLRRGELDAAALRYLPAIALAQRLEVVPRLVQVLVAYADYLRRAGRQAFADRVLEAVLRHPVTPPSMLARAAELRTAPLADAPPRPELLAGVVAEALAG